MAASKVYDIKNLKHRYGQGFLLDIPSLTIERNRSYGFVGPNGSGKTTLLRILLGSLQPDSGSTRRGANVDIGYFDQQMIDMIGDQTTPC